MLAEHPTEPRFGLDADNGQYAFPPATWNDLNWAHLAADADALARLGHIDLTAGLPDTSAVTTGAGEPPLAWHSGASRAGTIRTPEISAAAGALRAATQAWPVPATS